MSLILDGTSGTTGNLANGDLQVNGVTVGKGGGTISTNTAVGASALAGSNSGTGNNTAVGYQAGYTNSTGPHNTFVGTQAGYSSTGGENTCVGRTAGYSISTGTGNTFVGPGNGATSNGSGYYVTTGSKNSILGGYNGNQDGLDIRTASNYVVLSDGDGSRAAYWQSGGGWVQKNNSTSWSTYSDQRIKENIQDITGLNVITALRPVEFDYKVADKKHDVGFIAQEYQTVLPNQVIQENAVSEDIKELTQNEPLLAIQQNLVPYLVKAIQELKILVDAQAVEIAELKAQK